MRILVAMFFGLWAGHLAAQDVDCDTATAQMELTYCAEQEWTRADEDLNDAYRAAIVLMKSIDAGLPQAERGAEANLRAAQRAWVTFRDAACAAEGYPMHGGSAEPMVIYGCRAQVSAQRAKSLWELAESY